MSNNERSHTMVHALGVDIPGIIHVDGMIGRISVCGFYLRILLGAVLVLIVMYFLRCSSMLCLDS